MTKEQIDQMVKELAKIDTKIQSSEFVSPADLRMSDKLRAELHGHWNVVTGTYSKIVEKIEKKNK